jgi:hypothetical protein
VEKNRISIIFALITIICIFSVAAIADQCGCRALFTEESKDTEEVKGSNGEKEGEPPEEEAPPAEEPPEGEEPPEIEPVEPTETGGQAEAPTITLEICEGPVYSSGDNICYYRVEAIVTGTPSPDVEFSKDDSNGTWGEYKAQVNLENPSDTYNLTATATNLEGNESDSIFLDWQCQMPNNSPVINDISVHACGVPTINSFCAVEVDANDPDGDSLSYIWNVSSGSIDDPEVNPMKWNTPGIPGDYEVKIEVSDGAGSVTEESIMVEVYNCETFLPLTNEGGEIIRNVNAYPGNTPYMGDSDSNQPVRGYISFNICSLSDTDIEHAIVLFDNALPVGDDPGVLVQAVWLEVVDWGSGQIELNDFNIPGILISEIDDTNFQVSCESLINELQKAADMQEDRFQLRIRHKGYLSDNDHMSDGWSYQDIKLTVIYK